MTDLINVTGIIIKSEPIGEYDRRIVLLTTGKGKVTAFARGARRPNNRFVAGTNLFCFGDFGLYGGRNSYTVNEINVKNYFDKLHGDYEAAYMGMYFAEIADYYSRENADDLELMKLFYQSLRALMADNISNELIRAVYEIKAVAVNGEFKIPKENEISTDLNYTLNYILNTPVERLYNFKLSEKLLEELKGLAGRTVNSAIDIRLKSLDMLNELKITNSCVF